MAWQDEAVPLLRNLIGDVCASSVYTDSRLEELLVASGYIAAHNAAITTYTITIATTSISPDPSSDSSFMNLMVLRAAMMLVCSEAKTLSLQAYRVVDGPSSIDLGGAYKAAKDLCDMLTEQYNSELLAYQLDGGGTGGNGKAVLSPYTYDGIAGRFF